MNDYNGFTGSHRAKMQEVIRQAIKDGRLKDPMECRCTICGKNYGLREYHNEDYSPNSLLKDARVVCRQCHYQIHRRFDNPERFAKYMLGVTLYDRPIRLKGLMDEVAKQGGEDNLLHIINHKTIEK